MSFKSPFNPYTKQAHSNDDGFFAWKNIESWNGDSWTEKIDE
jgi:hypothetical protein